MKKNAAADCTHDGIQGDAEQDGKRPAGYVLQAGSNCFQVARHIGVACQDRCR